MTQGKPPVNLLDELGFVLEERAGVWVVQEDAGGCYPASLTERVLWKALLEMHQQRQCLHKISEPANASVPPGFALVPVRPTRAMDDVLNEEGWQWDDLLAAAEAIEEQHPDDAAVDTLAALMKAKLAKQRARGYGGWDTPECTQQRLSDMLRGHVDKGDPVDVANFCAFLAARGEGIALAAPAAVAVPSSEDLMTLSKACQAMPGGLGMHYWNYAQAVLSRWGAAPKPPAQAQEPFGYVNTHTGQFFKDVETCRKGNEGHWRTVYTHPAPQQPAPAAQGVLDATRGMAAEYERWIGFFHRGDGDYNDFLRIELNHDASAQAQQGAAA